MLLDSIHTSQLWTRLATILHVSMSTGDKDIAQWIPPLQSFQCTYARAWVQVKHNYALTIDTAEKAALEKLLDAC